MPEMGLNRHIFALRYAPISRGGFKIPHLHCEMGIIKIKQIVKSVREMNSNGNLIIITTRWIHSLVGNQENLLTNTTREIGYVDNTWWSSVRDLLNYIDGELVF